MKTFTFPSFRKPYVATIRDRPRVSGLTSVRFYGEDHLVLCDFNERATYLVRLCDHGGLELIDHKPTVIRGNVACQTDLMDMRGDEFVVTNFFQGSLSFYEVRSSRIQFTKELNLNAFIYAHGVRFIPGHPDLVWISYCGPNNKCIQIVNYKTETLLHHIDLDEQAQDVAFLDAGDGNLYALQVARTPHISEGKIRTGQPLKTMYATAYLYEVPADLENKPPVLIDTWQGAGHLDAAKEFNNQIFVANQYTDCIDVFSIASGKIAKVGQIPGFGMPHGLDIRQDGLLAVTNYSDQTLRIGKIGIEAGAPSGPE